MMMLTGLMALRHAAVCVCICMLCAYRRTVTAMPVEVYLISGSILYMHSYVFRRVLRTSYFAQHVKIHGTSLS